jgi:hypothetical protein
MKADMPKTLTRAARIGPKADPFFSSGLSLFGYRFEVGTPENWRKQSVYPILACIPAKIRVLTSD